MRVDRSRLPEIGRDPLFPFPRIVGHMLDNHLEIRTIEHFTVPVVSCVLQVECGTGMDPVGQDGLAAITADMLDEGVGTLSAIEVSEAFARIGAEYDVDVGSDATTLGVTVLSRFAQRGVSLLADLVTAPRLREADFQRVRQLRVDRLRQLKDVPPAVAERAFLRLLYGEHPYGHLAIGTDAALRALQVEDVSSFHSVMYRPSRATLILAGPMPHEELRAIGVAAFSEWQEASGTDSIPDPAAMDASRVPPRVVVIPRAGAPQSELRIGHLSARRSTPDYWALLVMNAVLGGQFVSRINLKLREEKGYTYGARTGFDWKRGAAPFVLQAGVHTAATADAIRDSLDEIDAIRGARPPSDTEMTLAKASLTRGYPRNFETAGQVARSVAQLALYELPDSYFEEFVPKINSIGPVDVMDAARRHVDPARTVVLIVGDYQAIDEGLRKLGLGEPQLLPAD